MADKDKLPEGVTEEPIGRAAQTATATADLPEGVTEQKIVRETPAAAPRAEDYGFTGEAMLGGAKQGLYNLGRGALQLGRDVIEKGPEEAIIEPTFAAAQAEHEKARKLFSQPGALNKIEAGGHELASMLPIVGPWAANIGEEAGTGNVGGALARGATEYFGAKALPKVVGRVGQEITELPRLYRGLKTLGDLKELPPSGGGPSAPPAPRATPFEPPPGPPAAPPTQLAPIRQTPFAPPAEAPPLPKMTLPGPEAPPLMPKPTLTQVINQATGAKPLAARVPLGEQLTGRATLNPVGEVGPRPLANVRTPEAQFESSFGPEHKEVGDLAEWETGSREGAKPAAGETDPLKIKYPDPKVRQLVRANGEQLYEAAKGDPETLKAVHDLTRVDLRQALINAGEDMGQTTVSDSKFAGEGSISRQEALNRLLNKGVSPKQMVALSKPPKEKP